MAIIDKPSDYFNTVLYTGNGSTQSITGVNFQTDFTWVKNRSNVSDHILVNSISGVDKNLKSNSTGAEITNAARIISFDTDGLTVGNDVNNSGNTYASWNWLAGGTASSNTDGSITSSVSANQDAGFSIVSWTGTGSNATVGHGLGSALACYVVKSRDSAYDWRMYHQGIGATKYLNLNQNIAEVTASNAWNNTAPTSSVFSLGSGSTVNQSSDNFIAYCFADTSMSKMGSYTGNGSADGTFVYTGFRPAFLLAKNSSTANRQWYIVDNKRSTSNGNNVINKTLAPNQSNDESWWGTNNYVDFVSNGFKFRDSYDGFNESGGTYIYMCFAEHPFVTSTSIPTTAR